MKRKSKYNAKKVETEFGVFDSTKEWLTFLELKDKADRNEIFQLDRQIRFELQPGYVRRTDGKKVQPIYYVADFVFYDEHNKRHIVDCKSEITKKDKVYRLKKKIFEYVYPEWIIEEV